MRFILDHFKLSSAVSIALLLCTAVVPVAAAQQGEDEKTLQQDIATLKKDVKALREQQQQIIDQLNELSRLLRSNATATTPVKQPATIDIQGVPSEGDSAANVAIIEYGDFECPACGMYWKEVYPQIEANYLRTGKIKYFFRDLPLTMHPHAIPAARLAHCAGEQGKFWEMHDSLFQNQAALKKEDISARARDLGLDVATLNQCFASAKYSDDIVKSVSEAQGMGIVGTPTFYLGVVDPKTGVMTVKRTISGAYPYLVFKSYLDELLAPKKQ
jgi:protein-disulfide isomerase